MTIAIGVVLVAQGWEGWSVPAWLSGAGLFVGIVVLVKGYWRPAVISQVLSIVGIGGGLGIALMIAAFNLLLSAAFIGAGVLLGQTWRILL